MNKKIFACLAVLLIASVGMVGTAYAAYNAPISNTGNTVIINDITAISLGKYADSTMTPVANGSLDSDLSISSVTSGNTTTYSFAGSASSVTMIDVYVYQVLNGAPAATGTLTMTLTTAGIDWSGVNDANITATAGGANGTITGTDGALVVTWNDVTIPAYDATPEPSDSVRLVLSINSTGAQELVSTSGDHAMNFALNFE